MGELFYDFSISDFCNKNKLFPEVMYFLDPQGKIEIYQ